jgi:tripartite ATP-independent transporter DctM subunit
MIVLLGTFVLLLLLGVPLMAVLAGTGLIYLLIDTPAPLTVVPQRMFVGIDDFTLTAIPLFILAGYLMAESGITRRLIRFAELLLRGVYAGLAQASVLASMVFGGVSGVAAADMAAIGIVMIPEMERDGYKREFATSTIMASSLMGAIIPPSIPFIIYGITSSTSIGQLFLAGAVPGVLVGVTIMATNFVVLKRSGFHSASSELPRPGLRQAIRITIDAALAVVMPLVIIAGIVGGVFTPTEAGGVAVAYAFAVGLFIFRNLRVSALPALFVRAAITSSIVMVIVVSSSVLNWAFAYSQLPRAVAEFATQLTTDPTVFLVLVVIVLLIVGIPLDPVPGVIIMTPVLLPAATLFGIDPLHLGVVMVMSLTLGLITPPVGATLFVATAISGLPIERLSKAVLPFLAVLVVLTLAVTLVPPLWRWLPELLAP